MSPRSSRAAAITGADAIHPGLGFLAEDADFAATVEEHGLTFIGPSPEHIRLMGNKVAAKEAARKLGIPTVPGSAAPCATSPRPRSAAARHRLPGADQGRGGRRRTRHEGGAATPPSSPACCRSRSTRRGSFFGCGEVYLERHLERPRHIEVQILGDGQGGIIHLGERDCSLQRRHQKVLEETPSPALNAKERERLGALAVAALGEIGYTQRRHARIPISGRRVLFYRDEHPPAGRAPDHRDDQRHRHRPRAAAHRRRRAARLSPVGHRAFAATRSSAGSMPRTRTPSCPRPAG